MRLKRAAGTSILTTHAVLDPGDIVAQLHGPWLLVVGVHAPGGEGEKASYAVRALTRWDRFIWLVKAWFRSWLP